MDNTSGMRLCAGACHGSATSLCVHIASAHRHHSSRKMKRQREMEGYLEMENAVVAAIFQVGLTQSSPKSLISLMPETPELTRE